MILLAVNDRHEHSQTTLEENTVWDGMSVLGFTIGIKKKRQKRVFHSGDWEPSQTGGEF